MTIFKYFSPNVSYSTDQHSTVAIPDNVPMFVCRAVRCTLLYIAVTTYKATDVKLMLLLLTHANC